MKLKFKTQAHQIRAVESVVGCFTGQPKSGGMVYRIDAGRAVTGKSRRFDEYGFKNAEIALTVAQVLENVRNVQRRQNLPLSSRLTGDKLCPVNLDVEMETGTGKTYCYIKTMFELNKQYGWNKFIIVVPSIAIREGVAKSLEMTADHFLEAYGKRARAFIYSASEPHKLESFSSDTGINVMVINAQAFNATGKEARRIYEERDDFQSRRPIDIVRSNRPILILDEPQKMEGAKTLNSLKEFAPLFTLRYSATHRTAYNKIHRLDALDAYRQKLVKKIAVRGISVRGSRGTSAYLYLDSVEISASRPPVARVEMEVKGKNGIRRVQRKLSRNDNLFEISGGLEQYKGFVIADIDARVDTLNFTNGAGLAAGEAMGDVNEATLRRIQIREAVKMHFEKERQLFDRGIKVLTLFFIDEVAKYRRYDGGVESPGEYATIFEEEYEAHLREILSPEEIPYTRYLRGIGTASTHNGYFSVDRKSRRFIDPDAKKSGDTKGEADDVDAYDIILKDKERLLSFDEPVRFIFSHSALREGWDNPNIFVICALKHSDNTISRRQEVGRGLRLAVDQDGNRVDDPETVHRINVLTVVAGESYSEFVSALQQDVVESLSERPRIADEGYFTGKILPSPEGDVEVNPDLARQIHRYLLEHDYTGDGDRITQAYHHARRDGTLAALPPDLSPYAEQVFRLIDGIFTDALLPDFSDDRKAMLNPLNDNFHKEEFKALWECINRKALYTVHFDSETLIDKCVAAIDEELKIAPLQYVIQSGGQAVAESGQEFRDGEGFTLLTTTTEPCSHSIHSMVKYDLIGKLAEATRLTRRTIAAILMRMKPAVFSQYETNPEDFIAKAAYLVNAHKATATVEHLAYDPLNDVHPLDIFTREKPKEEFTRAVKTRRHIYDYLFTDSAKEREFVKELDTGSEVVVYARLPRGFFIPTPVGDYSPGWAIAFREGKMKHLSFVAETRGSFSSPELRAIEQAKIDCARKFFSQIAGDRVRYDVVESYENLMQLAGGVHGSHEGATPMQSSLPFHP